MRHQKTRTKVPPEVATNPLARRDWILRQVRLKGRHTITSLAEEWGVHRVSLGNAWWGGGFCDLQERTAEFLGVPVQELFPELYDPESGGRLLAIRTPNRTTKPRFAHVQNAEAV